MKRIISFAVVFVLLAGMAGFYFLRTRGEDEIEYIPEGPVFTTYTLMARQETDVETVVFRGYDFEYTMIRVPNGITPTFIWADNPDFLLDNFRARDKVRHAWSLVSPEMIHESTEDLDLSEFGLDPPELTMTVTFYDGEERNIFLGAMTSDRTRHFVMVEDDPALYLISTLIAQRMQMPMSELIDRAVPRIHVNILEYFYMAERGQPTIEMEFMYAEGVLGTGLLYQLAMVQPFPDIAVAHEHIEIRILEPFNDQFAIGDIVEINAIDTAYFGFDDPLLELRMIDELNEVHLLFGDIFMREEEGIERHFVYVKFPDRPHIFEAPFEPIASFLGVNPILLIQRFAMLVNIQHLERFEIFSNNELIFDIHINHDPDEGSTAISPTINGISVLESPFRTAYRMLIAISADRDVDEFTPQGIPYIHIIYYMLDGTERNIAFFEMDANTFYVSVNNQDVWFVTGRRGANIFMEMFRDLIS